MGSTTGKVSTNMKILRFNGLKQMHTNKWFNNTYLYNGSIRRFSHHDTGILD